MNLKTTSTQEIRRVMAHACAKREAADAAERGFLDSFIIDMVRELKSRALDPFTLDDGLHTDEDGRTCYSVHTHRGHKVVRIWDRINGASEARVIWAGEICNFNSTADAETWLDEQIEDEEDGGQSYEDEHRLRAWQVV